MSWAIWLAVPISATALAALWSWWRGMRTRTRSDKRLDTDEAMRLHQDYLDALVVPARAQQRCPSGMELEPGPPIGVGAPSSAG